jgi:hypothetical protein
MKKQEVFRILVLIEQVYSYCSIKDETVINWFELGREEDFNQVIERFKIHIRKNPYPPTLHELLNRNGLDTWIQEYSPRKSVNIH